MPEPTVDADRPATDQAEHQGIAKRFLGNRTVRSFWDQLQAVDFGNQIILIGASLLLSVLPLVILISAFANNQIDDDIATRLGLNSQGSHLLDGLFRTPRATFSAGVVLALAVSLAGTVAVARMLQSSYESVFAQQVTRGLRNVVRLLVWVLVTAALVAADATVSRPVGSEPAGRLLIGLMEFAILFLFFAWSIHFLLAGELRWRRAWVPAGMTALFWIGLGVFASFYLSSSLVSDGHLYGAIGVIFSLTTWFIAMSAVLILGPVAGVVVVRELGRRRRGGDQAPDPDAPDA